MNTAIIRNANIYAPDPLGNGDILIVNDKIAAIGPDLSLPEWADDAVELDAKGRIVTPGLIDGHVHTSPEAAAKRASTRRSRPCRFPCRSRAASPPSAGCSAPTASPGMWTAGWPRRDRWRRKGFPPSS